MHMEVGLLSKFISVKIRMDLRSNEIEALWLQVHIPHLKPILVGCCYRLPNANSGYLDKICDMIEVEQLKSTQIEVCEVCDYANKMYLLGDFNINWNSSDCPLKNKLLSTTDACSLTQNVTQPTRVC